MARAAKGLMLVSGAAATFEAVQPALATMTADVWYLGERPDLGAAYKLFGNAMLMTIVTGLADVLAMAGGLDIPALEAMKLFDRFQPGVAIPMRGDKMARRDYSAMFELRHGPQGRRADDRRGCGAAAGGAPRSGETYG